MISRIFEWMRSTLLTVAAVGLIPHNTLWVSPRARAPALCVLPPLPSEAKAPKQLVGNVVPTTSGISSPMTTTGERGPAVVPMTDNDRGAATDGEYQRGILTVGGITLLFASNSPAIHAAFANSDLTPPVLLLNAAVSVVALTGLLFGGRLLEDSTPLPSTLEATASTAFDARSLRAGVELGSYKMLGTTANIYGLSLTSADHGAFLIQLTTLIVPVVQGIRGVPVPRRIWTAIALAIGGVALFTTDPNSAGASLQGDGLCVLAALLYATYDLRLFHWGRRVTPLPLITTKIFTQAVLSVGTLVALGAEEARDYITSALASPDESFNLVVGVVVWCGVAVNAIAPFLQVNGTDPHPHPRPRPCPHPPPPPSPSPSTPTLALILTLTLTLPPGGRPAGGWPRASPGLVCVAAAVGSASLARAAPRDGRRCRLRGRHPLPSRRLPRRHRARAQPRLR